MSTEYVFIDVNSEDGIEIGGKPSLETLCRKIGCRTLELVKLSPHYALLIDSEGELSNRPVNKWATRLLQKGTGTDDFIVGPAILVKEG